jgi:hypothetical protein
LDDSDDEVVTGTSGLTVEFNPLFFSDDMDANESFIDRDDLPEEVSTLETVIPTAVVASSPTAPEVQATLSHTQEETLQEIRRLAHSEQVIRLLQELRGEMLPLTRRVVPDAPEPTPITAQDAEAIARAYLEDELSDLERGAHGLFGEMAEDPVVTAEEAEIDRTLWRLHVD